MTVINEIFKVIFHAALQHSSFRTRLLRKLNFSKSLHQANHRSWYFYAIKGDRMYRKGRNGKQIMMQMLSCTGSKNIIFFLFLLLAKYIMHIHTRCKITFSYSGVQIMSRKLKNMLFAWVKVMEANTWLCSWSVNAFSSSVVILIYQNNIFFVQILQRLPKITVFY